MPWKNKILHYVKKSFHVSFGAVRRRVWEERGLEDAGREGGQGSHLTAVFVYPCYPRGHHEITPIKTHIKEEASILYSTPVSLFLFC